MDPGKGCWACAQIICTSFTSRSTKAPINWDSNLNWFGVSFNAICEGWALCLSRFPACWARWRSLIDIYDWLIMCGSNKRRKWAARDRYFLALIFGWMNQFYRAGQRMKSRDTTELLEVCILLSSDWFARNLFEAEPYPRWSGRSSSCEWQCTVFRTFVDSSFQNQLKISSKLPMMYYVG